MADRIAIAGGGLSAAIDPLGAELVSLRDAAGRELMTDADPAFWSGHAPLLFPIVGRLADDMLRIDGRAYPMRQHGFARRSDFAIVSADADRAVLRLVDTAETRAAYPFAFRLDVAYILDGARPELTIAVTIANPGDTPLPASFGFHPAFAWPLPFGCPRAGHRILFERDEPAPPLRLADGLIAGARPSPLDGQTLLLDDALFADDALVWTGLASRRFVYGAGTGPQIVIAADAPDLGIWTKPGARFICVEPWHGHADPAGFAGDFRDKPGVFQVPPGGDKSIRLSIALTAGPTGEP